MDRGDGTRHGSPPEENISRTFDRIPGSVEGNPQDHLHLYEHCAPACSYVLGRGRGGAARFCGAAAAPGASYCARHRALCQVDPASAAARPLRAALRRAAQRPAPPPPRLGEVALLEPPDPDEDPLAGLGLPHARPEDE